MTSLIYNTYYSIIICRAYRLFYIDLPNVVDASLVIYSFNLTDDYTNVFCLRLVNKSNKIFVPSIQVLQPVLF